MTMRTYSPEQIRAQLGRLLASKAFASAGKIRRFLEFTVEHAIDSPQESLKEIIIGNELYATNGEFDPRLSAVVRVDATRLRSKLREYYVTEGSGDSLVIELPKGTYTPVFRSSGSQLLNAGAAHGTDPSIVVLPFTNLSPEPGDYFSDGLTEEIIHALSSVRGMRVVARTSSFALKHKNADVREVGRTLSVDFVLEGSIRKSADALRVTARLVSANDGYQLWSRRYDRRVDDVFAVQDDIAREIVGMLRVSPVTSAPTTAVRPSNFEAYAWYLRGRFHLNRQTRESFHRAIDSFEQALLRSPDYPAALSAMGVAWFYLGVFSMDRPLEVLPKARDAAARALATNSREGEVLSISACTKAMYEHDWAAAENLFRQALDAEPGSELSKHLFALCVLLPMARMDEALAMVDEATRIDPLSLFVSATKTAIFLMSRRTVEAEAECRRALELDPDFWRAVVALGRCYEAQGRYEQAIQCFERATVLSDHVPTSIGALGRAYALAGQKKEAYALIAELDQLANHRYVSPYAKALIYLGLDDEQVFDYLEQSYRDRTGWLMFLASDPRFDPLRSDRRFHSLLERLRLPIIDYGRVRAQNASV
jgi:TolB-like protein/cytochrome c-type biogenesis protein CcmH/NrfG